MTTLPLRQTAPVTPIDESVPLNKPSTSHTFSRLLLYGLAIGISLFFLCPIYFITITAFSPQSVIFAYPKNLLPVAFAADTVLFFWNATGVQPALLNSVIVGILTLILSLVVGAPAGYALARFFFRGRDSFKLLILTTRAFPIIILAIPLAVNFLQWGLYDTLIGVALAHTAMALPTTILVTSSIFVGVARELEEAAQTLGCSRVQAFLRVALPLALPGLAASALFTFVLSWNEVFAATMLTLHNRTLPALLLTQIADVSSPLPFRYAGGFFLVVPALVFIFFMRRYLLGMWGQVVK